MKAEAELDIHGHAVRLEVDLVMERAAPRTSNPDSPWFSDPGEGGQVDILNGFVMLVINGKTVRERKIPKRVLQGMRTNATLENFIYQNLMESFPDA